MKEQQVGEWGKEMGLAACQKRHPDGGLWVAGAQERGRAAGLRFTAAWLGRKFCTQTRLSGERM